MDKGSISNKRVGPNKHVGWNFSRTLINVQLGSFSKNPSKITIRDKKLEVKFEKTQFLIN